MIGTGVSRVPFDVATVFGCDVEAIDFSQSAIRAMSDLKGHGWPSLRFSVANATALPFPDASFDLVLDKGCLDSVLASADPQSDAPKLLSEVRRVLCAEGRFVAVSCGPPDERLALLGAHGLGWRVSHQGVPTESAPPGKHITAYTCAP